VLKYIPGTATLKRTRKTKAWEHRNMPTMYTPAHLRSTTDLTEFYEKPPQEMSRYELQELEHMMRLAENNEEDENDIEALEEFDEDGNSVSKLELFRASEEFKASADEIRKIQPMRIGIFKRYWSKFKFNKKRREVMVNMFDETDK
jgi:hypothetical protein